MKQSANQRKRRSWFTWTTGSVCSFVTVEQDTHQQWTAAPIILYIENLIRAHLLLRLFTPVLYIQLPPLYYFLSFLSCVGSSSSLFSSVLLSVTCFNLMLPGLTCVGVQWRATRHRHAASVCCTSTSLLCCCCCCLLWRVILMGNSWPTQNPSLSLGDKLNLRHRLWLDETIRTAGIWLLLLLLFITVELFLLMLSSSLQCFCTSADGCDGAMCRWWRGGVCWWADQ